MFPTCVILLCLILAYRTAEAFEVNKNLGKNQRPAKVTYYTPKYQPPSFCNGVECPRYEMLKKYSGFEHRQYDATQWISTLVTLSNEGLGAGYMELFQYISGSNSAGRRLNITSPVVIMAPLSNGEPENGTMSLFLSANLKDPPKPLKSTIYIQRFPKASLYVKSFSGIASKEDYARHIQDLANELIKLGRDFDKSFFACNIYDPPTKLRNRHNEVWFLAAQD